MVAFAVETPFVAAEDLVEEGKMVGMQLVAAAVAGILSGVAVEMWVVEVAEIPWVEIGIGMVWMQNLKDQ